MSIRRMCARADVLGALVVGVIVGFLMQGTALTGQSRRGAMPAASALQLLVDKDQIRDQIYNYCRGLDRMDKALALSVWHPDATVEMAPSGFKGSGPEWIESAWRTHEKIHSHTHQMTNILMQVNGDKATSETYFISSLHAEPTDTTANTRLIRGRYLDRWSKRGGRWAMDHRQIVVDFSTVELATGPNAKSAGRRDTTDPSYRYF